MTGDSASPGNGSSPNRGNADLRQHYHQMLSRIDSALGKCDENQDRANRLYQTYEKILGKITSAVNQKQQKLCFVYLCKRETRKDNPADPKLKYIDETLDEVKKEIQEIRHDYKEVKSTSDRAASLLITVYSQIKKLGKDKEKYIEELAKLGGGD